jgi:hypothetical protein
MLTDLGKILRTNFSGFAGYAAENKLRPPGVRKSIESCVPIVARLTWLPASSFS